MSRHTFWEANALGYRPYVEWYKTSKPDWYQQVKMSWLDVWTPGPVNYQCIFVDMSDL